MVGVEQWVPGGVEVREDDTAESDGGRSVPRRVVCLEEVNGIQRYPADHEEKYDDGEVLGRFDLPLPRSTKYPQHRPLSTTTCAVHCHYLFELKLAVD